MPYSLAEIEPFLSERAVVPRVPVVAAPTGRPGDDFNAAHNAADVLGWLGFSFAHKDHTGEHWTRPGKSSREGASATVYADGGTSIWSSTCLDMWPSLQLGVGPGAKSYDPFGLLVATKYNGDFEAAAQDLADGGYGEPGFADQGNVLVEEIQDYLAVENKEDIIGGTGWEPIDLSVAAKMGPPPRPDILVRSDGVALLYRKKINFFFGPPESAKSWVAQYACVQVLRAGGSFLYLDFENSAQDVADHFRCLGVNPEVEMTLARGRAIYMNPTRLYNTEAKDLLSQVLQLKPWLVVIDGMTGAMRCLDRAYDSNTDFAHFEMEFMRPLTASGAALVAIDHVPKNSDGTSPIGAQHKKAATTGAMMKFFAIDKPGRGKKGRIRMYIEKDKGGWLRRHCDEDDAIADFFMSPVDDHVVAELHPAGATSTHRPDGIMERVSRCLEDNPSLDHDALLAKAQDGLEAKVFVPMAFRFLMQEGYISFNSDNSLRLNRPYRQSDAPF